MGHSTDSDRRTLLQVAAASVITLLIGGCVLGAVLNGRVVSPAPQPRPVMTILPATVSLPPAPVVLAQAPTTQGPPKPDERPGFYRDRDGDWERVRPGMTAQAEEQREAEAVQKDRADLRAGVQEQADARAHPEQVRARLDELTHQEWEIGVRVSHIQYALNATRSNDATWNALRQRQREVAAEAAPLERERRRLLRLLGP